MGLSKINKPEPLAKTALKALRHSILTNELTTGEIYNEKSLAESLGISRTPIREALLELSSKRLVRLIPQKGIVVNTFSHDEIEDVFETRMALEAFFIRKACLGHSSRDLTGLKRCLDDQKKAAEKKNPTAFMTADRNFHIELTRLADNEYLMGMMQDIRDLIQLMGFKALGIEGRMQEVIKEHEKILAAFEQGRVEKVMELMERHLTYSKNAVEQINQKEKKNG